jgi:prolyl oligopeptidase
MGKFERPVRAAIQVLCVLTGGLVAWSGCSRPSAEPAGDTLSSPELDDEDQSSVSLAESKHRPTPAWLENGKLKYPQSHRGDVSDEYFGTRVADPYRWLEDPGSPQTKAWIKAENDLTFSVLENIPQRPQIHRRLTELVDYERFSVPMTRGGKYFFERNDGLQNQSVLYVADSLEGKPRTLLDPNDWSPNGTVALKGYVPSDDGKLLAYGRATAGSDWEEWKVRDVETGKDRDDHLRWIKFSGASWAHDGSGFYYSRYDEPKKDTELTGANYYQKLYFHRVGDDQTKDRLVYERKDEKEWGFYGEVTDDGRYLVINVSRGTEHKNLILYIDLQKKDAKVVELISGWDAEYGFVDNDDDKFWLLTDSGAPRYRLIQVDLQHPDRKQWKEVIPQSKAVLESVSLVGERFFATFMADAQNVVNIYDLAGKQSGTLELPGIGSVGGFTGRRHDQETFYSFTSFTTPTTIFRYDMHQKRGVVFRKPKVQFKPDRYETRQVFYTSRDDTRVPMFITARKGLELNGQNPTNLWGYGGFNIPITPAFSPSRIVWLEMGGVLAIPNLRGGGEFGREWHEEGMKQKKQNVFDDFIAAAEYLIRERYTSTPKLAISGGSNGGLLVGAVMTQRPELFGAALPAVGVLDMLRFQKFTIGWAWVSEYGSSENEQDFHTLIKYSPLQNIRPHTNYPATLIETGDHDDRVVPAHSFKFAAALQAAQAGPNPILIRIETSAGHGAGKPTSKMIEEVGDGFAFLVRALDMPLDDDFGNGGQ